MKNLNSICSIESDKNFSSSCVGVFLKNNDVNIVFPRGYNIGTSNHEIKLDIILLLKVFDKYIQRKKDKAFSNEFSAFHTGKGKNFPFSIAIWLLNNFSQNGLYKNFTINYKLKKNGHINWNRTLKTVIPYVSNDELVYLNFITKEKNDDISNTIILIQKFIIRKCIDMLGWLFPNLHIDSNITLPYSKTICINLLKKELRSTSLDKYKQLFLKMIEFLENSSLESSSYDKFKDYKTNKFHYIWEDMINVVLGNDDPKKYYPNATWVIDGFEHAASSLRPDTILNKSKAIFVLDAKYYKYGITNKISDLPQSSDINKQFLYSEHIFNITNKKTFDAFILPYLGDSNKIFKFVGNAIIHTNKFKNKKVVCILADIKTIMKNYIYTNNLDEVRTQMIKIIIEQNIKIKLYKKGHTPIYKKNNTKRTATIN